MKPFLYLSILAVSTIFFSSKTELPHSSKKDIKFPLPGSAGTWTIEWSPDEAYIAYGGDDSLLKIFKPGGSSLTRSYKMNSMIKGLSWHPDSRLLAISLNNGVQLLDMETGDFFTVTELTTGGRGIGWNYTGELLGLADGRGVVQIMNKKGELLRSIKKHNNHSYLALHWHPSKNIIVTSSDEIILFDTSGRQLNMFNHRKERAGILSVRWHPSGKFFASGDYGHDGEGIESLLQFWKEDGTLIKIMHGSKTEYRNIRWNRDGSLLATASDALRTWSKEGKLVNSGKTGYNLWGISWNSKGSQIITSSFDGNIDFWTSKAKLIRHVF